jgi:hypothetical protein
MSLLHQNDASELDDAARGESFTKGTSHVTVAFVVAAVVVSILIAWYVISGQKPPVATGQVISVWVHPQHVVTPGLDAAGASLTQQSFDQVMVFADVRLHNQSNTPLFLYDILTNATLPDGIHSSYAANTIDYNRVFVAYPDIKAPHGKPLSPLDTTINPGQTVEGEFVSAFHMTDTDWNTRKGLNFSFAFRYQPNLVLTPSAPVIAQ